MKGKLFSALILIVISSLVSFHVSCCSPLATPTGTINAYLDATVAQDAETCASCFTEDFHWESRAQFIEDMEYFFEGIESLLIANRDIVVDSQAETSATVTASFDVSTTYKDDTTDDQSVTITYTLSKIDGQWLISNQGVGRNEEEARRTEKMNVSLAVTTLMLDSGIGHIPNPVTTPTRDMNAFPDISSNDTDGPDADSTADKEQDPDGADYDFAGRDLPGYRLWNHDNTADGESTALENYVSARNTDYYYTCDADGTVHQWDAPGGTEYID